MLYNTFYLCSSSYHIDVKLNKIFFKNQLQQPTLAKLCTYTLSDQVLGRKGLGLTWPRSSRRGCSTGWWPPRPAARPSPGPPSCVGRGSWPWSSSFRTLGWTGGGWPGGRGKTARGLWPTGSGCGMTRRTFELDRILSMDGERQ